MLKISINESLNKVTKPDPEVYISLITKPPSWFTAFTSTVAAAVSCLAIIILFAVPLKVYSSVECATTAV